MSNNKPIILWCWWYDRKDLLIPLLPVMKEADNHFLFYRFPEQEELHFGVPGKRHYWTDFPSPFQLIDSIKPDKVVFMGIENMLTIALLSACRKKQISTYYLMHGLTSSYEKAVEGEVMTDLTIVDKRYSRKAAAYRKKKYHSLIFYGHAFKKAALSEKGFLFKFLVSSIRFKGINERLFKNRSRYRQADKYLVFTKHIARLLKERDGVDEKRMIDVGVYTLDYLFEGLSVENGKSYSTNKRYLLLIDQPMGNVPGEQQLLFLKSIIAAAEELQYMLIIKLHPSNYEKHNPLINDNCLWVRDEKDLVSLVRGASACLGFFSTLLLPIIMFKPTILFNPTNQTLVDEWDNLKVVTVLPYSGITVSNLKAALTLNPAADLSVYKKNFIYQSDGKSTTRLIDELINTNRWPE